MVRDDFVNYKKSHYVSSNTVVVVSGDITNDKVYKEVDKYFKEVHTTKAKIKLRQTIHKRNQI